jgi:ribosomal protein L34
MRSAMRAAAITVAATAATALPASALAHETVTDHGVAVTMHVLPGDEPQAGQLATIVIVKVKPPSGRFTFGTCGCRIRVTTASGRVLLNRRAKKRTPFVFPDPAAYEVTYSGGYRAKGGKTKRFSTTFALRAN